MIPELYFTSDSEWRIWLQEHHDTVKGVYLIFYTVNHENKSMRWEEAVKVALCFGWIDSTVKSLGAGKRKQYFTPRNPTSAWSALNKKYIKELLATNQLHASGLAVIKLAKQQGSWHALDDVENGIIPADLQASFDKHPMAFENYQHFAPSYRKSYLYWLNQAKREQTRVNRIAEIIRLCAANKKSR